MKSEKQLENFYHLKFGMTRSEVVSIVGEPDGEMGSGIIRPFYVLGNGSYVILTYGPTSKTQVDAILHRVEYQSKQGNIITIDIN